MSTWPFGERLLVHLGLRKLGLVTGRQMRAARKVGALGHLPLAFSTRVGVHLFAGELQAAASLVEQSDALAEATYGRIVPLYGARSGRADRAAEAFELLCESTRAASTPWGLGVEARSRALLTGGDAAEALYRASIDHLQSTRLRMDLARAHLLHGEWLRRQRRRLDPRDQLRVAHELFSDFGTEAFAARAAVEPQATGDHARKRTVDTRDQLTPKEADLSRLAARGDTSREIAAQLFISPSTVEYHLRKVFRKLDVKSRTQLARRMS